MRIKIEIETDSPADVAKMFAALGETELPPAPEWVLGCVEPKPEAAPEPEPEAAPAPKRRATRRRKAPEPQDAPQPEQEPQDEPQPEPEPEPEAAPEPADNRETEKGARLGYLVKVLGRDGKLGFVKQTFAEHGIDRARDASPEQLDTLIELFTREAGGEYVTG